MEEELRKLAIQRHIAGESSKAICTNLDRSKKWIFKLSDSSSCGWQFRCMITGRLPAESASYNLMSHNISVSNMIIACFQPTVSIIVAPSSIPG